MSAAVDPRARPVQAPARGRPRTALVLAGGGARGAYEVGVLQHIVEDVARELGRPARWDLLCGTSVGAINACALAAFAHDPRIGIRRLVEKWTSLSVEDVARVSTRELFAMARLVFGSKSEPLNGNPRQGGLLDPSGLEQVVASSIPFEQIGENLRSGHLGGITISTTHVATGRTVVFVQRAEPGLPTWGPDPTVVARAVELRAAHVLASAAIPLLFPAVRIAGEYYSDGGLRQNVPLSPARRLGASGLVVINPRYIDRKPAEPAPCKEEPFPGPLFLLGKTLDALMLDRLDNDIDRLERINQILHAGIHRYGPGFVDEINLAMGHPPGKGIRPLATVLIRTSRDIGALAADFVRSPVFAPRVKGMLGRIMQRLAEGHTSSEADLLSYLLFDGDFVAELIALGRADARDRHEDLCTFFEAMDRREPIPR